MKSFLFLVLSASFAFAEDSKDPQGVFKKEDPKLSKKTTEIYRDSADPDGTLLMTRVDSYLDGDLTAVSTDDGDSYYEHTYDEKGRPKERRQLDADHKLYAKFTYTYAEDGSCKVKTVGYGPDGKEIADGDIIEYSYDAAGKWLRAEQTVGSGAGATLVKRENEFDAAGRLSKSTLSTTAVGMTTVDEVTSYSYNGKGGWLDEESVASDNGTPILKLRFNSHGDVVEGCSYDGLGNVDQRVEVEPVYKDDGHGARKVSEVWKLFQRNEPVPVMTGYNSFKYEYVK